MESQRADTRNSASKILNASECHDLNIDGNITDDRNNRSNFAEITDPLSEIVVVSDDLLILEQCDSDFALALELSAELNENIYTTPIEENIEYRMEMEKQDWTIAKALQESYTNMLPPNTSNSRRNVRQALSSHGVMDLTDDYSFTSSHGTLKSNIGGNQRPIGEMKKVKGIYTKGRIAKECRATREGVLDPATRLALFKMIQNGTLEKLYGVIKTGKESSVFAAVGKCPVIDADGNEQEGQGMSPLAVKVFRTTLNEFGNRSEYYDLDYRFRAQRLTKGTSRDMIRKVSDPRLLKICYPTFYS